MNTKTLAKINNVEIQVVQDSKERLVPIRPICDALGVAYPAQFSKIQEDDFLSSTVMLSATVGADKKEREMVCLPLQYIFGWLFTINPKNVKEEAREAVSKYRIECYNALYNHFAAQSEFLQEKQRAIEGHVEEMEKIRAEFNSAKDRLNDAKKKFNEIREVTFEQWQENRQQLKLEFAQ